MTSKIKNLLFIQFFKTAQIINTYGIPKFIRVHCSALQRYIKPIVVQNLSSD